MPDSGAARRGRDDPRARAAATRGSSPSSRASPSFSSTSAPATAWSAARRSASIPRERRGPNVPRVGGTKTPRLERIRALEPTHAVVNVDENRREDADALAAFVPNVVVTHPLGPRDNPALYRLVGGIFADRR